MSEYKDLQQWGHQRRRTITVHQDVKPGDVLLFSDRKRYKVMPNGQRIRIPDAPIESQVQAES
jgi:hypothetical protein